MYPDGGDTMGSHREGEEPKPMMHGRQKSEHGIVAMKLANTLGRPGAKSVERRPGTKGNMVGLHTPRTQARAGVSLRLDRVRQVAKQRKKERFDSVNSCIATGITRSRSKARSYGRWCRGTLRITLSPPMPDG